MHRLLVTTSTIIVASLLWLMPQTLAHEYYLMPETFTPTAGTEFAVRHRLGQKFKGNELPWITSWNIRSEVWESGEKRAAKSKDGDRPALKITSGTTGLITVVHQSNVDILTFKTWEKFQNYTKKEGLEYAQADSETGTKPKIGLKEAYSRFTKTLLSVDGSEVGTDTPVGLKIELVALAHPRILKASEPMPVQLLYDGKPLGGALVKVFVSVGTEFAHQILTDANGRASIPAGGPGPYLLNAIHMTEPQGKEAKSKGAHWESFWASLTFERKE